MFLVTQVIFVYILCLSCKISSVWNTLNMLFVCGTNVDCAQYNVRNYGEYGILLLDMCLLYIYLNPEWLGQYLGTYHNNVTYIYSAVDRDVYMNGDTFFHGHICSGIINMAPMRLYIIIIGFKNMTWYFTRTYALRIVTSIFEVFQTMIPPC